MVLCAVDVTHVLVFYVYACLLRVLEDMCIFETKYLVKIIFTLWEMERVLG